MHNDWWELYIYEICLSTHNHYTNMIKTTALQYAGQLNTLYGHVSRHIKTLQKYILYVKTPSTSSLNQRNQISRETGAREIKYPEKRQNVGSGKIPIQVYKKINHNFH